jgi:heme exporter protein C
MKTIMAIVLAACIIVSILFVFIFAPEEESMGVVQKIFYFHVASAWVGFLAFFFVFIGSICYLVKKSKKWDTTAHASAGIGVLFTTLCLISGSLWAKPAWGIWWSWDARLASTLVLWFIYVAYLIIRFETKRTERGATFGAVLGIIGFIDIPIVFMSVRWWRTVHCDLVVMQRGGLTPMMLLTLLISVIAFTVLYLFLLMLRFEIEMIKHDIETLKQPSEEGA